MGHRLFLAFFVLQCILCFGSAEDKELSFDEKACGSTQPVFVTAESNDIYSPGFLQSKNYSNNIRCSYMFLGVQGKVIEFSFKTLDLEVDDLCDSDQLSFRDSNGVFKTLCGKQLPGNFTSNNTYVTMTFKSDFMVTGRGFHFTYRYKGITSDGICGFRRFLCRNDVCVPNSARCNNKDDCGDGSDEALCAKGPRQPEKCGETPIKGDLIRKDFDRVVGGQVAVPGSWPWQADLQINRIFPSGHICGGALINDLWVITAAHCFGSERNFANWRVKFGHHNKFEFDEHQQVRRIERFVIYGVSEAKFRETGVYLEDSDIALVKLNAPVKFNDHVRPVCLPPKNREFQIGTKCFSSGFGDTRGSGHNNVLKQVEMEILPMKNCENDYYKTSNFTLVCAGNMMGGHGVCHGDSGGPLVCPDGDNDKWYITGVVSFLTETNLLNGVCAAPKKPSAYSKIVTYQDWITSILTIYN